MSRFFLLCSSCLATASMDSHSGSAILASSSVDKEAAEEDGDLGFHTPTGPSAAARRPNSWLRDSRSANVPGNSQRSKSSTSGRPALTRREVADSPPTHILQEGPGRSIVSEEAAVLTVEPVEEILDVDMPTTGLCADAEASQLKIRRGGQLATCEMMKDHCFATDMPSVAERLRQHCPKTCRLCNAALLDSQIAGADRKPPEDRDEVVMDDIVNKCVDHAADAEPIFMVDEKKASCRALLPRCKFDAKVKTKCPVTCGLCPEETNPIGDESETSWADENQGLASQLGCQSRRRFGWCATRRRRYA